MGWWFYDYVLKDEEVINWPMCFFVHMLIHAKMFWYRIRKGKGATWGKGVE